MSDSSRSSPAHSFKDELPDEIAASPDQTLITGWLKFRDQKKWKLRWGVLTKLSPAADCIHLQLYKDSKDRYKQGMTKASLSLEHFIAIESGFTIDKESNTIAIICRNIIVILAFDSRERLIQWYMKISCNLGESIQFLIQISASPAKAKLSTGPAKLHIQNHSFCLTSGLPPKLIGYWELKHLRRYGVVDGKFCFEGGSLCGKGEGLYVFLADECEEISWNMHMASEGRLIPKRRFMTRNMSVIESPSKKYIQRPSESPSSGFDDLNASVQNSNSHLFMNVYEWASASSTPNINSDKKTTTNYTFHSQCPEMKNHWSEMNFQKLENDLNFRDFYNETENNYEKCDVVSNVANEESYTEIKNSQTKINEDGSRHFDKRPERPPKPLKYKSVEQIENSVINEIKSKSEMCLKFDENALKSHDNLYDFHKHTISDNINNYDVPKTFCSKIQTKVNDHVCFCIENVNSENQLNNYDIPPAAVPVNSSCSCTTKMRLVVESKECYKGNVCPCQHFVTCWPYNWLQLAYCRKGNTIQDTTMPFSIIEGIKSTIKAEADPMSLYAKVDLSKKTKRKLPDHETDSKLNQSDNSAKKAHDFESKNNYANLYFEKSLKYYENARELIKNTEIKHDLDFHRATCNSVDFCERCTQLRNHSNGDELNGQANYIIMNPVCSLQSNPSNNLTKKQIFDSSKQKSTAFCANVELSKSMEKFSASSRQRSDSTSSAKSVPSTFHFHKNYDSFNQKFDDLKSDEIKINSIQTENKADAAKCKSKSCVNRDSSSSNDSGFSFGSLKLHGADVGDVDGQCQTSIIIRNNSFGSTNRMTLSPKSTRSKSSDPLKDVSFQFLHSTQLRSDNEIPKCHKKVAFKKDSFCIRNESMSSIPYIDSQSTSSETSDISDYIETLSLSSHSSSETTSNSRLLHPAASVLRPRSGKEYEKVNRILLQHGVEENTEENRQ